MRIDVKLKNRKQCDGCPCLALMEGSNYYAKCGLNFEPERKPVTRGEANSPFCNHPDLIAYYITIRPNKCIDRERRQKIKSASGHGAEHVS